MKTAQITTIWECPLCYGSQMVPLTDWNPDFGTPVCNVCGTDMLQLDDCIVDEEMPNVAFSLLANAYISNQSTTQQRRQALVDILEKLLSKGTPANG